ncbi:hypothetical protein EV426DRAFT_703078 [Tirmania nivea]|nr:hypothetical protein EV426DRAFT_703078 [Tirmania nivea]
MAPIPKGGGKGGIKIKVGQKGGDDGGVSGADLTTGEIIAVVLSCIFGPMILWMLFFCCLIPTCMAILAVREKRKQKKMEALRKSVPLVEQLPPPGAPTPLGNPLPSQTPARDDYYTPTASILTPAPPAYRYSGTTIGCNE